MRVLERSRTSLWQAAVHFALFYTALEGLQVKIIRKERLDTAPYLFDLSFHIPTTLILPNEESLLALWFSNPVRSIFPNLRRENRKCKEKLPFGFASNGCVGAQSNLLLP